MLAKNIVLFFVFFFVFEKGSYIFLHRAPDLEYDRRLEHVINGTINKDIIVLGSSRGSGNIIAGQIEKSTPYSCYNLSYRGSNIVFQEFVFKTLLKYNEAPKKVILVIDNPQEFLKAKTLNFRADRLFPLSKYNYINDELIRQDKRNLLSKLFYSARLSLATLKIKKVRPPSIALLDSYGSRPIIKESKRDLVFLDTIVKDYAKEKEEQNYIKAFKNIQALSKQKNIELIFAFCPNFQSFNNSFIKRFEKMILPENKIFVYDSLNPMYKQKKYFYDISHLNKKGAEVFTSEIITFINSKKNKNK